VLNGTVSPEGSFQIPASRLRTGGKYAVRVTRVFPDSGTVSVTSDPFSVGFVDWEQVAGSYEGMLVDTSAPGTVDAAVYRGSVTLTIARGGGVSGRLNYNEALPVSGATDSSLRAYRPVCKPLLGTLATSAESPTKLVFTPSPGTKVGGDRQVVSAELDLGQSPPALSVKVTDTALQDATVSSQPRVSGTDNLRKSLTSVAPDKAGIVGRYVISANAPERGYALAQVTSAGKILWITRLPGYAGSGCASLSLLDSGHAVASLYEARVCGARGVWDVTSLLGQWSLAADASGASWACRIDSLVRPSQLEKQQSYVSGNGSSFVANALSANVTPVVALDFGSGSGVVWNNDSPQKAFVGALNAPLKLVLQDTDEFGGAQQFVWDLQISASGAVRATSAAEMAVKAPALSLRFDKTNGELMGSYSLRAGVRRGVYLGAVKVPGNVLRQFSGWVEAGGVPVPRAGAAWVDAPPQ
jgi:hypothetical protein